MTETPLFEAMIVPHRSLGRAGLRWVLGVLTLLTSAIAAGLWWAGAWPVMGFCGAEVLLAVVLLSRNANQRRPTEMLLLTDAGLRVVRTDAKGRRTERLMPAGFLSTRLDDRPGRAMALMVTGRGIRLEVAVSLGEDEKRSLAAALDQALHRQRNPVFDNPQLRPPAHPQDPST